MTPLPGVFDALGVFDRAETQRERVRFWLEALRATVDYEQFVVTMRGLRRSNQGK